MASASASGLAAALVQVLGAGGFLVGAGLRFGGGLGLGVFLGLRGGGFGGGLAVGHGLAASSRRPWRAFGHGRGGGCFGGLLAWRPCAARLLGLFGALGLLAFAGFGFFAQAALLGQFFFLAADQLGLAARFFLAAGEFGFVDLRRGGRGCDGAASGAAASATAGWPSSRWMKVRFLRTSTWIVRARAGGVGLLDLAGRLLRQRDLLALGLGRAVAGLQEAEQALLVGLGQRVGGGRLGHACALELVKQGFGSLLEFVRELGDGGTGHMWFRASMTVTLGRRTNVRGLS